MSEGLELPTTPGIWVRGDDWIHVRSFELRLYWRMLFFREVPSSHDCSPTRMVDDSMPHGNWFPAVPAQPAAAPVFDVEAAAKEITDCHNRSELGADWNSRLVADVLRKHFQPAAAEGTVKGREAYIVTAEGGDGWVIHSRVYAEPWAYLTLTESGEWRSWRAEGREKVWPTREAAFAFIKQHADKPAATDKVETKL